MRTILYGLFAIILSSSSCRQDEKAFPMSKIEELKSQPVYNPPASVWEWKYKGSAYFYITSNCCDQYNELYDSNGTLVCYPDGGMTGKGDGKCPFNVFSSDSLSIHKTLIWKDDRKSASTDNKEIGFENQDAKIAIYVCSRGCYQYLISVPSNTNDQLYFPINLPEEYKQPNMDGVKITISATILDDSTQINKPAANDIPIPDFKAKNIKISDIHN